MRRIRKMVSGISTSMPLTQQSLIVAWAHEEKLDDSERADYSNDDTVGDFKNNLRKMYNVLKLMKDENII